MYFKDLFNTYRLRSGLDTFSKLGRALAEEGLCYEDSIFSKWKTGERKPKDRKTILSLLRVFIRYGEDISEEIIHNFLYSLNQRDLNEDERQFLFGTKRRSKKAYSEYDPISEPSVLLYGTRIDGDNTKIIRIEELSCPLQEYWRYQICCAFAHYYSKSSVGTKSASEIFKQMISGDFDNVLTSDTFIAVTTDPLTGQEFLSATLRYIYSLKNDEPLDFMNYIGIKESWPHERDQTGFSQLGEIDRFMILNWSWSWRGFLVNLLFENLIESVKNHRTKYLYSIMSNQLVALCKECNIHLRPVKGSFHLGTLSNAKILYPAAYYDIHEFAFYWKIHSLLYLFDLDQLVWGGDV